MIKKGVAASPGIGIGKAFLLAESEICINRECISADCIESELLKLRTAAATTKEQLEGIYRKALERLGDEDAEIIQAQIMILDDPCFMTAIQEKVSHNRITIEYSLTQAIDEQVQLFESIDDPYLRERVSDIKDVGMRLLKNLLGVCSRDLCEVKEDMILVGHEITPSQMAVLNKQYIKGIVSATGGATSHTAILARSMDIPAVLGIPGIMESLSENQLVAVDGYIGTVESDPDEERLNELSQRLSRKESIRGELAKLINTETRTKDGKYIEVFGNIGTPAEALTVLENGAEGIGLFRTEFLYMDRSSMPDEEEQFEAYKQTALYMKGKPVIIRTLDIGGDKEIPYFNLPKESNPFLGWRAIRVCFDKVDMFKIQLRAILRASAFGDVQIMYPMIAYVEEVIRANNILEEVKGELRDSGEAFNDNIKVGIMVEIPSAAITADLIIKEVDFFSIGTNDLTQYTLAVDRMNERVSSIYNSFSPSVLRLVKQVVNASHSAGKPTRMCGELAGNPVASILLLGLGLDEFSMSAASILKVRKILCSISLKQAEAIAEQAMKLRTATEVEEYLLKQLRDLELDFILEA